MKREEKEEDVWSDGLKEKIDNVVKPTVMSKSKIKKLSDHLWNVFDKSMSPKKTQA